MAFDTDGYMQAWERHDNQALVNHMTDDVIYEDVAMGERHQGRRDVKDFFDRMASEMYSDYPFDLGYAVLTDDGYAVEWVLSGTHNGSSQQMPATGKSFSIRGVSVGKLRGDLISENRDYWNLTEFLGQI